MLTDSEIEAAKKMANLKDPYFEHNDCIRIAYEWFDAQRLILSSGKRRAYKHIIERWGGRYVSRSDVEIAASLHPEIKGQYPNYNISARLTYPKVSRLKGIGEALTHHYRGRPKTRHYKIQE